MKVCTACLSEDNELVLFDEEFVNKYNILTNLDITLLEDNCLYACETCINAVNYYIEFREKCLVSHKSFQALKKVKLKPTTDSNLSDKEQIILKNELKTEFDEPKIEYEEFSEQYFEDDCDFTSKEDWIKLELSEFETGNDIQNVVKEEQRKEKSARIVRNVGRQKRSLQKTTTKVCKSKPAKLKLEPELTCGLCPKLLKNEDDLKSHLEKHKPDISCGLCPQVFLGRAHMYSHRMSHIPNVKKRCHLCNKRVFSEYQTELHYMKEHGLGDKDAGLVCRVCSKSFKNVKRIHVHMKCHSVDGYKHVCSICNKRFLFPKQLDRHKLSHAEVASFKCELCDFATKHPNSLEQHKIRMHNASKVNCDSCRKTFLDKRALVAHLRRACRQGAPRAAPSVCNVCGYVAENSSAYSRHSKIHMDEFYKCKLCPKKYKSQTVFRQHMDQHAGRPRYSCEFCDRKFYAGSVLIKHRRVHTGEKPYVCELCSKAFTGRHNLKVHMKIHGIYIIKSKNQLDNTND